MANQFVTYVVEENIATITINNPPANALSMPVMKESLTAPLMSFQRIMMQRQLL